MTPLSRRSPDVKLPSAEAVSADCGHAIDESRRLLRLMKLFARLSPPPDPHGLCPRFDELQGRFLSAAGSSPDAAVIEEAFLEVYCHLHGYEVPFTTAERTRFRSLGGYLCHPGGLGPILKAGDYITPETVSGDFGAGNGLQGLLMQYLYPHRNTVQIELSSRLVEAGRQLQAWIGIPAARVKWCVADIRDVSPATMSFVYIYRPVRPDRGRRFYERFAAELERAQDPIVVFSVADCLRPFLSDRFAVIYSDGHLTCFSSDQAKR